jgi:hypothetical protein
VSRHTIRQDEQYEVVVGWDRPLQTYFVQVFDVRRSEDDERPLELWEGTEFQQIPSAYQLVELVRPWAEIPEATLDELEQERAEQIAEGLGP